jgi:hypothetical protein
MYNKKIRNDTSSSRTAITMRSKSYLIGAAGSTTVLVAVTLNSGGCSTDAVVILQFRIAMLASSGSWQSNTGAASNFLSLAPISHFKKYCFISSELR